MNSLRRIGRALGLCLTGSVVLLAPAGAQARWLPAIGVGPAMGAGDLSNGWAAHLSLTYGPVDARFALRGEAYYASHAIPEEDDDGERFHLVGGLLSGLVVLDRGLAFRPYAIVSAGLLDQSSTSPFASGGGRTRVTWGGGFGLRARVAGPAWLYGEGRVLGLQKPRETQLSMPLTFGVAIGLD